MGSHKNHQLQSPGLEPENDTEIPADAQSGSFEYLPFSHVLIHAATFALPVFGIVLYVVPTPYIDEVFHVPLANYYCRTLDFTRWDPMITTPPGLYWLATAFSRVVIAPVLYATQLFVERILEQRGIPDIIIDGLEYVLNTSECGIGSLRFVNLVCSVVVLPCSLHLFFKAQWMLSPDPTSKLKAKRPNTLLTSAGTTEAGDPKALEERKNFSESARLILSLFQFPLVFFFSLLFYTDVWSTTLVVLSLAVGKYGIALSISEPRGWLMPRKTPEKYVVLSAIISLLSLTFRQTNVIWAAYIGATLLEDLTNLRLSQSKSEKGSEPSACSGKSQVAASINFTFDFIFSYVKTALSFDLLSFTIVASYAAVGGAFVAFYIWNDGITLGDKSHHQVSTNLGQLVYFLFHVALFMGPPVASWATFKILRLFSTCNTQETADLGNDTTKSKKDTEVTANSPKDTTCRKRVVTGAIVIGFGFVVSCILFAVFLTTFAFPSPLHPHPFLLADNRHYTFYIWRRVIDPARTSLRAALLVSPAFAAGAWILVGLGLFQQVAKKFAPDYNVDSSESKIIARKSSHVVSSVVFYLGVIATLVPSPLLEPRYYMVPFVLWRITIANAYIPPYDPSYVIASDIKEKNEKLEKETENAGDAINSAEDAAFKRLPEKEVLQDNTENESLVERLSKWPLQDFEMVWYTLINIVTIYVFVKFPFSWWTDPGDVQRFMW